MTYPGRPATSRVWVNAVNDGPLTPLSPTAQDWQVLPRGPMTADLTRADVAGRPLGRSLRPWGCVLLTSFCLTGFALTFTGTSYVTSRQADSLHRGTSLTQSRRPWRQANASDCAPRAKNVSMDWANLSGIFGTFPCRLQGGTRAERPSRSVRLTVASEARQGTSPLHPWPSRGLNQVGTRACR